MGSFASGPLHLGHILSRGTLRRPIVAPIAVGLALAGVFVLGAIVIRTIPPLRSLAEDVLGYARASNSVDHRRDHAGQRRHRGVVLPRRVVRRDRPRFPVLISTIIYSLATVAGGNPILVFAAAMLGTVVALQRRAGGGVLAPILTHITWSLTMLLALPAIFANAP